LENPYKKASKINPQKENGHREIENSILHALIRAGLSGSEYQIAWLVIDKTWGFGKPASFLSFRKMSEFTLLSQDGVNRAVKNLEKKRILVIGRHGIGKPSEYLFNKHWDTWLTAKANLSTKVNPTSKANLSTKVNLSGTALETTSLEPSLKTTAPKSTTTLVSVSATEPAKEILLKKSIKESGPGVKTPDFLNEQRKNIFEELKKQRGYNSPNPGAEAAAITWMLKQEYTVGQIMSAHDTLKKDTFWADKFLNMQSVKAQIGEKLKSKGVKHGGEKPEKQGLSKPVKYIDAETGEVGD